MQFFGPDLASRTSGDKYCVFRLTKSNNRADPVRAARGTSRTLCSPGPFSAVRTRIITHTAGRKNSTILRFEIDLDRFDCHSPSLALGNNKTG